MEKEKPSGDFQKNLNTFLLSLCVMGIGWVLKEVNSLDSRMAAQETIRSADHDAMVEMNKAMNDQSKIISNMDIRIYRLESTQKPLKQ